eukprot:TRINITY_DN100840_c0_g1_i1.p1 TRINITY_DN100840_c0_g1~~TRINITY_DN100840_c0_g1_i1.p1  ORF type:complete len:706 (+),score=130.11 TRINITY_DN100840_c0_g1_i1:155-2272(+)
MENTGSNADHRTLYKHMTLEPVRLTADEEFVQSQLGYDVKSKREQPVPVYLVLVSVVLVLTLVVAAVAEGAVGTTLTLTGVDQMEGFLKTGLTLTTAIEKQLLQKTLYVRTELQETAAVLRQIELDFEQQNDKLTGQMLSFVANHTTAAADEGADVAMSAGFGELVGAVAELVFKFHGKVQGSMSVMSNVTAKFWSSVDGAVDWILAPLRTIEDILMLTFQILSAVEDVSFSDLVLHEEEQTLGDVQHMAGSMSETAVSAKHVANAIASGKPELVEEAVQGHPGLKAAVHYIEKHTGQPLVPKKSSERQGKKMSTVAAAKSSSLLAHFTFHPKIAKDYIINFTSDVRYVRKLVKDFPEPYKAKVERLQDRSADLMDKWKSLQPLSALYVQISRDCEKKRPATGSADPQMLELRMLHEQILVGLGELVLLAVKTRDIIQELLLLLEGYPEMLEEKLRLARDAMKAIDQHKLRHDAVTAHSNWVFVCWATCAFFSAMTLLVTTFGLWMQDAFTQNMVDVALASKDEDHAKSLCYFGNSEHKFDVTIMQKLSRPWIRGFMRIRHIFLYETHVFVFLAFSFVILSVMVVVMLSLLIGAGVGSLGLKQAANLCATAVVGTSLSNDAVCTALYRNVSHLVNETILSAPTCRASNILLCEQMVQPAASAATVPVICYMVAVWAACTLYAIMHRRQVMVRRSVLIELVERRQP